jgi:hypothetical protein
MSATFRHHFEKSPNCLDAACAAIESPGGAHKPFWVGQKLKRHGNPKAAFEKKAATEKKCRLSNWPIHLTYLDLNI